jgi:hypothetical protein
MKIQGGKQRAKASEQTVESREQTADSSTLLPLMPSGIGIRQGMGLVKNCPLACFRTSSLTPLLPFAPLLPGTLACKVEVET